MENIVITDYKQLYGNIIQLCNEFHKKEVFIRFTHTGELSVRIVNINTKYLTNKLDQHQSGRSFDRLFVFYTVSLAMLEKLTEDLGNINISVRYLQLILIRPSDRFLAYTRLLDIPLEIDRQEYIDYWIKLQEYDNQMVRKLDWVKHHRVPMPILIQ